MSIEANQIMNYLLGCFENHQNPKGGWYLEEALRQLTWDKQFDSLKDLDLFFEYHRNHSTPFFSPQSPSHDQRNTILLLSAYIGQVLSNAIGEQAIWYSYQKFTETNPKAQQKLPQTLSTSMLLHLGNQWLPPIDLVLKQLSLEATSTPLSIQVENIILAQQLRHISDPTTWMHVFQQMVYQQAVIPGGLAYADIIEKHKSYWDYSINSLQQLDSILYQIQLEQDFVNHQNQLRSDQVNFIFWVGAYLGSTIANLAQCPIYWHNQENISQALNEPTSTAISHLRVAQFGADWHFILGFVNDYLLGKTNQDIHQYAYSIIKTLSSRSQISLNAHQNIPEKNDALSKKAMLATGFTAAHMLSKISKQTHLQLDAVLFNGKETYRKNIEEESVESYWQRNPNKLTLLSLGKLSSIYLPIYVTPCIEVKTKICLNQQSPLTITIGFPFLPTNHYRGFTILQPYLLNTPQSLQKNLEEAAPFLLLGIQQFEQHHAQFWQQYQKKTTIPD